MRVRGIIVLVKSNQLVKNMETKHFQLAKRDSAAIVLVFKAGAFRYQRAITYSLVDSSTNQSAALLIDNQLDFTNILQPLSPAKASLCCGEAGDKEKESAFCFFDYCHFYPAGASAEGESSLAEIKVSRTDLAGDDGYSCDF